MYNAVDVENLILEVRLGARVGVGVIRRGGEGETWKRGTDSLRSIKWKREPLIVGEEAEHILVKVS